MSIEKSKKAIANQILASKRKSDKRYIIYTLERIKMADKILELNK